MSLFPSTPAHHGPGRDDHELAGRRTTSGELRLFVAHTHTPALSLSLCICVDVLVWSAYTDAKLNVCT